MAEELVLLDISRVQEYVLRPGVGRLALIRGGSAVLKKVSEEDWPGLARDRGGRVIVKSGGNLLAVVPAAVSGQFREAAARMLWERSGGAVVRSAGAPYRPGEFQRSYREVMDRIAAEKATATAEAPPCGSVFGAPCEVCGAAGAVDVDSESSVRLCAACSKRRESGRKHDGPKDFDAIGRKGRPAGYIALVHLDFDRMGEFFDAAAKREDVFENLSCVVKRAIEGATVASLAREKSQVLLCGGDDLAVVLPACDAFDFLSKFAEAFKEQFRSAVEKKKLPPSRVPTFSAGVVMGHTHYPIGEYFRLGKALERSAKSMKGINSVDWEIVTSALSGDPVEYREGVCKRGRGYWRTGKPYLLEDVQKLTAAVGRLRNTAPSSKINELYHIAYRHPAQAEIDYVYLRTRLDGDVRGEVENIVGDKFWQRRDDGSEFTKAADFAELWGMI